MKLGEFKNARDIMSRTLTIIEDNKLEVISMNFVNVEDGKIKIDFVIKSNNYNKNKVISDIEKEFRYNDWNDDFKINEINNFINVIFYIK